MSTVIKVENVSKQYRLGVVGSKTLTGDMQRLWAKIQKKEDPFLRIGSENKLNRVDGEYVWALKEINFEVKQGEVLGIIGKNGAGKSTLLKLLSRVTSPTMGEIKIKGRVACLLEVGTGFHQELTGRENIFLNGAILGMIKSEIRNKFDEIVDFSGVEKYIDTPVKRYSSGMYVRLAFAVAAHLDSEILIVDEVLAVGDSEFQKKCLGKMHDISENRGRTILFVSHNLAAIKQLCKSGIFLNNGKILNKGDIESCIVQYTKENTSPNSDSFQIIQGDKDLPIFIKQAELMDENGLNKNYFDIHDKIIVKIEIICKKALVGCTPMLDLKYNSILLYKSFTTDRNPELLDLISVGKYLFSFQIPSPLKKGRYSIDLRIGQLRIGDLDFIEDALTFQVDEISENLQLKSYSVERHGLIAIDRAWNIEKIY